MRNEQPGRTSMLRCQVGLVETECDPRSLVSQILERYVRGVSAVGVHERKGCVARDAGQQRIERHAFPHSVELPPPLYAMDIRGDAFGWQLAKRPPAPSLQHIVTVVDRQLPLLERNVRSRTGREHRKFLRQILPRREGAFRCAASTNETSRLNHGPLPATELPPTSSRRSATSRA